MSSFQGIGAAVIGAGFIGPVHVEGLKRAGVPIRGILGVDEAESKKAAQALGLPKAYRSLDELLADTTVQVVHVATPNRFHYEQVKAALMAGKHVLCEKPLAMDSNESSELVELARHRKLVAAVNYNLRFYPLCLDARAKVQAGDVGDIFHVGGSYVQDWLLWPDDYNWRVLASEGGKLRAVADIGTHWLDLVQTITGLKVVAVCATLRTVHPIRKRPKGEVQTFTGSGAAKPVELESVNIDTEDCGVILFKLSNGAIGTVWVSQVTAGRKNCLRFEISGSKTAIAWDSEDPNIIWYGHRDRANESLIRDPGLLSKAASKYASYPGGHAEGFPDTFKQHFRAVYDYIAEGDLDAPPPFPTFEDGHHEIKLCEAIFRSHGEQKWIELPREADQVSA